MSDNGPPPNKLIRLWREETAGLYGRYLLARLLLSPLPPHVGSRLRPALLRLAGFDIGSGTVMWGTPRFSGAGDITRRLHIGQACWFNVEVLINLGAAVQIGDGVAVGHQVMILTESHTIGDSPRRAGPVTAQPVQIGAGAWLGARALILPGVTIGAGAVVAAGAVVSKDVPPNTLAGGVPAKVLRELGVAPALHPAQNKAGVKNPAGRHVDG